MNALSNAVAGDSTASALADKVCLVTGATSGMGLVTAEALARQGATTIMVGRSRERAEAAADRIREQTGNESVDFIVADLSSQTEIRRLAAEFKRRHQHLHVLVNNVGAWFTRRRESADGIEMTFALNYLGHFLLTDLLLDVLKASSPSRIVNIASYGHAKGRIDFDDLEGRHDYNGMKAYRQSKLADVMFTYELARRLEGAGVSANAVNPGLVASNFGLDNFAAPWLVGLLRRAYGLVALSAEEGAKTAVYLATSEEVQGVSGRYFEKQQAVPSSEASYDRERQTRLWKASEEMTGLA